MPGADFRVYAELNDFLPISHRQKVFQVTFDEKASIKHVIESLGIPHTEVDLILINGNPFDFNAHPVDGDFISVYPVFERLDIGGVSRLRPKPLRIPRFVLDTHLGKLAVYLRMLGFDTLYENDYKDEEMAVIADLQKRILLTRDRGLLKRNRVTHGSFIHTQVPIRQLLEVVQKYDLYNNISPFTRCLICNETLVVVEKGDIWMQLPPQTSERFMEFKTCPRCGRIFWKGSHYQRMKTIVDNIQRQDSTQDFTKSNYYGSDTNSESPADD